MRNTRAIGDLGEHIAATYLQKSGYRIIERNAVLCDCEVDIICDAYLDVDGRPKKLGAMDKLRKLLKRPLKNQGEYTLVFCEVKTRYDDTFGSGAEAVDGYKVGRYVTAAGAYTMSRGLMNECVRFDIIEINDGNVRHIPDAFTVNDAKYSRR